MSSIRKAGVTFYPGVTVGSALTGLAATLSAKYKLRTDLDYTIVGQAFTEDIPGTYSVPVTINDPGDYLFVIESTNEGIENLAGNVLVTNAGIDDVKVALDAAALDITSIKSQIDILDETSINNLTTTVAATQTTLDNIKLMLDDANGDTSGLNSIMDFVTEINNAVVSGGTTLSALSGYTDNLELMLEGKPYVNTDGITVDALDSKGLSDIYSLIESVNGDTSLLGGLIGDLNTTIVAAINNAHSDIITRIATVNSLVTANQAHLENSGYGLSALMTALDALKVSVDSHETDKTDILGVLNHATDGLAAIKTTIMDKLAIMDAKLDNIVVTSRSKISL
jgi:hypothetical protein